MNQIIAMNQKVQELRRKLAEKAKQMRQIHEAAGDEPLDDDGQSTFDALQSEVEQIRKRIEQEERLQEIEDDLEKRTAVQTVETHEPGNPDVDVTETVSKHWRRRTVRYFNALAMKKEDEQRAASMMSSLIREARELPARQLRDEEDEASEIVKRSGLSERRQSVLRALLGVGEFRLLTSAAGDTQGGDNLLPKPFLAEIFVLTEQFGLARQLFRIIPFNGPGNTLDLKNVVSRVIAYWVDQGELIPPSDMEFGPGQLTLNKLAGITSWTTEAEEDLAFSFIPMIQQSFAESIAEKEDRAGFLGDGTATYGGYTGVLNLPDATVVNTGSTDGAVTEADLRAVKNSVPQIRRRNARWVMHESVMDAIRQLENTAGFRLFTEPLSAGGASTLLGYPVSFSDVYPAVGSADDNDIPLLSFGDHSRMLMAVKRGVTADISREAILQNPSNGEIIYNAYQADGALLRVTERVGFAIPKAVEPAIAVLKTQEDQG